MPVRVQMGRRTRLSGGAKAVLLGLLSSSFRIILDQIGEAPVIPEATWLMGELSLLPTQAATT